MTNFFHNEEGNFGMLFAIAIGALVTAAGGAVDMAKQYTMATHLQSAIDATSLILARSINDVQTSTDDTEKLLRGNFNFLNAEINIITHTVTDDDVFIEAKAVTKSHFLGLIGIEELKVVRNARVVRESKTAIEVALVLDTTWSMSERDDSGSSRLDSLKAAANNLVKKVMTDKNETQIAVVPYSDYVNVGINNRYASWMSVPSDYSTVPPPRKCETRTTRTQCNSYAPKYQCTREVDGVSEAATCGGNCTSSTTVSVAPYEQCSGGGTGQAYTWYGCVRSRTMSDFRLSDTRPDVSYVGFLGTYQTCASPLLPLTNNKSIVQSAINNLSYGSGGYRPSTFIPTGLVWGLNVISPSEPFNQGLAYDSANKRPRKIVVLMTDGENTLKYYNGDGSHRNASSSADVDQANNDSMAVCNNLKARNVEVFTVGFLVESTVAQSMLKNCATDSDHYFDASTSKQLELAFDEIAVGMTNIRLVQ
ncbi:VWA domain-containing protein [Fulvimarina sp. 2208YS6-2-32]|uniref:VWA domain-containing protein n=1 Tax=Fulvimarina uroteuthidis TaxID=3098149 RepID=A0ABU5IA59_9HYPH|nr:VWA domain-containing protein [Fulvimarina sp. 2208YS6-2-32]MDY8111141.1 VWA domain-containing protein [Fulvimarina sp. 2208YS6-2-32]